MNEAATQNWSSRGLERQIGAITMNDRWPVKIAQPSNRKLVRTAAFGNESRQFVRDPVLLEFVGLHE